VRYNLRVLTIYAVREMLAPIEQAHAALQMDGDPGRFSRRRKTAHSNTRHCPRYKDLMDGH
jgi:hypothetical protein